MHNGISSGMPAWRQQQQPMFMYHQNQFGGGHPDPHMIALLQTQQRQYYPQQPGQGMWNPSANQLFSDVDPSTRNGNFMMQQYRFFGHDQGLMYPYQQQQQRFGLDSNANPNVLRRPGWAESRPGRTPCEKNWWSHVVSEMLVVDSPCGLDLDVEDEHANVMEELRKTGSKAGTGIDEEVEAPSPGFAGLLEGPKGVGEATGPTLTPTRAREPAATAGGCLQMTAEAVMCVSSPHQPCDPGKQPPRQAQAPTPPIRSGVPASREQMQPQPSSDVVMHPQRHLCNASERSACENKGRSPPVKSAGSRAAANSSSKAASSHDGRLSGNDGGAARSLCREVLGDAEGEQGERAAGEELDSAGPQSMNSKGRAGGVTKRTSTLPDRPSEREPHVDGEQQEPGKEAPRSANTLSSGIGERPGRPRSPRTERKLPRPGNSFFHEDSPGGMDQEDNKEEGGDSNSDQYSSSDGSDGSHSSGSGHNDSEGSGSDEEAEYSAMQRSSQSGIGGQSTLEYSAFHDASVVHARHSIVPSANHATANGSTGSFLGTEKGGHSLYLEATASNALIDVQLLSMVSQSQKTAAANTSTPDGVASSFRLGLSEVHPLSANAVFTASSSVDVSGSSITTAAEMEKLGRGGYEMGTLAMVKTVPEHASRAATVGAAGGARSRSASATPTAAKILPTATARKNEEASALPKPVVGGQQSISLLVGEQGGSNGANDANNASKAGATQFSGVRPGGQRERLKRNDAAADRLLATRASRDLDSSKAASLTYKGGSPFPGSSNFQGSAAATTSEAERTALPVTELALATAAKGAAAHKKTNASATTSEGATPTIIGSTPAEAKAGWLPIIRSTQHVHNSPANRVGSVQVPKSLGKRPSPFPRISSAAHRKHTATPLGVDKAKAAAVMAMSLSSTGTSHVAADHSPPTSAGVATSAATAGAVVTELKPAAQSAAPSSAGCAPVSAAALTLAVASAAPPGGNSSAIRSSDNLPRRVAAASLSATASPAVVRHHSQPQPPCASSLKKRPIAATDALGEEDGSVLARATPPGRTAGSACERLATVGAPKRLSTVLLSDLAPSKPAGVTATAAAAMSVTRNTAATAAERSSCVPKDTNTAVKGTAVPSGVATPFPAANSVVAKSAARAMSKAVGATAGGNALKHSSPPSLSPLGLAMKPKTVTAATAAPPRMPVSASQANAAPASRSNERSALGGDDSSTWPEDPYDCYGYIEPDLAGSHDGYAAKSLPTKAPAGDRAMHRYSMVESIAVSPLSTSSTTAKTDAASAAGARVRQSNEGNVLEDMGYMYY
ncbi:hypothetical protein LSCM1_06449 [Leishmania martiniquensis]|uniref:Uncharacterized protein n=1 Tax=Leishmania martiniquensis TaxID=1580590 RepID=A0A836HNV9_9TRYP|nr:hypothetical protein LSCM1_06449 [Leishmania martiniquensis]